MNKAGTSVGLKLTRWSRRLRERPCLCLENNRGANRCSSNQDGANFPRPRSSGASRVEDPLHVINRIGSQVGEEVDQGIRVDHEDLEGHNRRQLLIDHGSRQLRLLNQILARQEELLLMSPHMQRASENFLMKMMIDTKSTRSLSGHRQASKSRPIKAQLVTN